MIRISRQTILLFGLISFFSFGIFAQTEKPFLGLKLRPEVRAIADEIEQKTKRKVYPEFFSFEEDSILGTSFISDEGTAIVRAAPRLKREPQKLEAVIAHELLHMRLRVNNYPVFLFSLTVKTAKGLAQDVEQDNINDLTSLIEHRIFKAEMDKFGLNQLIDLAGDAERSAIARGADEDGQSDALNFARAVLEYQKPADIERLRKVYVKNRWQRALKTGREIAALISGSTINSPEGSARVFRLCLAKLYPTPRPAKLTPDKTVSAYRQMLISY
jgi:hypothetical protein